MNAYSSWISGEPVEPAVDTGFDVGDVVRLISGGPALTVLSACEECGEVEVAWFDGASLSVQGLPEEALVYAD
ncbi:MAG: DUF2158 domain-containing protein [Mesorhizobium sp.]|uniref:DUF2158 domain-containing protein n=1 Tax=Mesorhizobium sp. TaxID=1871066 RepID=UPI0012114CC7|nr:DUF2158 domain-containing protein [Mesorhizobium sp.]TIL91446.1 MAG: DUF2158 domain-containing protein [Mesorhizobium sp.]